MGGVPVEKIPSFIRRDMSWMDRAKCSGKPVDDFFLIDGEKDSARLKAAERFCVGCQVIDECLRFAIETKQVHGVWGGMSASEIRVRFRRSSA